MSGYDTPLLMRQVKSCPICSHLVHRADLDDAIRWHNTLTNLPKDAPRQPEQALLDQATAWSDRAKET